LLSATQVKVSYSTSPEASACKWLPPEQTAGKARPYLFTQSQAIHARYARGRGFSGVILP
jgi:leukotriene-A4 hydrolase